MDELSALVRLLLQDSAKRLLFSLCLSKYDHLDVVVGIILFLERKKRFTEKAKVLDISQ